MSSQETTLDRDQLVEALIAHVGNYKREVLKRIVALVRSKYFNISTARKEHHCFICDKLIAKGTSTYGRQLFFDGRFTGFRVCGLDCLKKLSEQFVNHTLYDVFEDAQMHAFVHQPQRKNQSLDEFRMSS